MAVEREQRHILTTSRGQHTTTWLLGTAFAIKGEYMGDPNAVAGQPCPYHPEIKLIPVEDHNRKGLCTKCRTIYDPTTLQRARYAAEQSKKK